MCGWIVSYHDYLAYWQAGQSGTHIAKLNVSPTGEAFSSLVGENPQTPERTKILCGCASLTGRFFFFGPVVRREILTLEKL